MRCHAVTMVAVAVLTSCKANTSPELPGREATASLRVAFLLQSNTQSAPVVVAEGFLLVPLSVEEASEFEGTWRLRGTGAGNVNDALEESFVAPLSGEGQLRGTRSKERWIVDMSPRKIDDNVELIVPLTFRGEGTWQYVTDAGVSASGVVRISAEGG